MRRKEDIERTCAEIIRIIQDLSDANELDSQVRIIRDLFISIHTAGGRAAGPIIAKIQQAESNIKPIWRRLQRSPVKFIKGQYAKKIMQVYLDEFFPEKETTKEDQDATDNHND